jgi:sarcosine oxidase subunit beta
LRNESEIIIDERGKESTLETADVVVVGAGANGISTAFHLARAGVKRVVVVERRYLGSGATGKSGALVRMHYTNEPEVRLAFYSLTYFQHWKEMVGGECGFQPLGLLVFTPPEYQAHLEANLAMMCRVGIKTQLISVEEAHELDPSLWLGDVRQVAYEPESGFADPNATISSLAQASTDLGVTFHFETEVTRVLHAGSRVQGVETTHGTILAPVVVIAAGAWANQLFAPLGIDLGLIPRQGRVTVFRWPFARSARHLTYIDKLHRLWARPIDSNCTLVGTESEPAEPGDPNHYSEAVPQDYIDLCRQQLSKRFPIMGESVMRGNWACMLMESPDSRPIIGPLEQYEGLYCMAGDSGTSFKTSPAIGKCLTELITQGRATTVDLTPFRATRFAEGKSWKDEYDYGLESGTISR